MSNRYMVHVRFQTEADVYVLADSVADARKMAEQCSVQRGRIEFPRREQGKQILYVDAEMWSSHTKSTTYVRVAKERERNTHNEK